MPTAISPIAAKSALIRAHNDIFREHLAEATDASGEWVRGQVVITQSVASLPEEVRALMTEKLKSDLQFTQADDPYEEHDMGWFDVKTGVQSTRFMWKIDYYASPDCNYGSEDPSDLSQTYRVLTIMDPSDY